MMFRVKHTVLGVIFAKKMTTNKMNYYRKHTLWGLVLVMKATTVFAGFPYENVTLICPETQPVPGKICAMPYAKGSCGYGEICCPGEGGKCIPETYCSCSDVWRCESVGSGALPCQTACPEIAPQGLIHATSPQSINVRMTPAMLLPP
jgi:hypothetical protein